LNDKSEFVAREANVNVPPAGSLFHFDFYKPLPIQIEVSKAPLTSDAGLLPLRQFDQCVGHTQAFADALDDPRDPDLTEYTYLVMVRSRVYGILAGSEDPNDHDTLLADLDGKRVADRSAGGRGGYTGGGTDRCQAAVSLPAVVTARPAGRGPPGAWRTLLLTVAAEVVVCRRRMLVRLSSSWPHRGWYRRVCQRLRDPVPHPCG
jgi:hypothetical protein